MKLRRLAALLTLVAAAAAVTGAPVVSQTKGNKSGGINRPAAASICIGAAASVVGAIPACRLKVRRLFNRDGLPMNFEKPADADTAISSTSSGSTSSRGGSASDEASSASPVGAASTDDREAKLQQFRSGMAADMAESEKFALTPDKLATIAELNDRLESIASLLAPVPIFTAAVGNGTSPLTVPTEDGRKLAYFFTEKADAEAFLRAVKQSAKVDIDAQVIGASLQDIIKAYSTPEAKGAKETFVLIPTMAEVAAARQLMRSAGKDPSDPEQQNKLGPHSGLVPVFWSEALAVQSAGGKQRKVLFFRMGDLSSMWQKLSESRKQAGEQHNEEMPQGPTVQVSDLQTMAGLLVQANKTDDIMFLPSSKAIESVQGSGAAGARVKDGTMPAAMQAAGYGSEDGEEASSSSGAGGNAGDDFGASDDMEEEEEAGGVL